MGRKSKLTEAAIEISVQNVRSGMTQTACAQALGISYETWRTWMALGYEGKEPYARFYIRIEEANAALQKECLDAVRTSIKLGNVETAKWLLERKYSSEFGKRNALEVNAKSESVNLNIHASTTAAEKAKIRNEILAKLAPKSSLMLPE